MKKLLSLMLALCLCFCACAVLGSCNKDDGGSEPTYTVTKEEWQAMFLISNATIIGTYEERDLPETNTIKIADGKIISSVEETDNSSTSYIFQNGDKWYYGRENEGKYYCEEFQYTGNEMNISMFSFLFRYQDKYDDFTYNEEEKCYLYVTEEKTTTEQEGSMTVTSTRFADTVKYYVENGKIQRVLYVMGGSESIVVENGEETKYSSEGETYDYVFSNYGSTAHESYPTFCFNHTFDTEWSSDENMHWHACQTPSCGAAQDRDWHQIENGICTICGYTENE